MTKHPSEGARSRSMNRREFTAIIAFLILAALVPLGIVYMSRPDWFSGEVSDDPSPAQWRDAPSAEELGEHVKKSTSSHARQMPLGDLRTLMCAYTERTRMRLKPGDAVALPDLPDHMQRVIGGLVTHREAAFAAECLAAVLMRYACVVRQSPLAKTTLDRNAPLLQRFLELTKADLQGETIQPSTLAAWIIAHRPALRPKSDTSQTRWSRDMLDEDIAAYEKGVAGGGG